MRTNVLVVEDEPEFMRRFADAGLELAGGAAIALLDADAPDAMLVDRGLPDISGVEVIRHATGHHPDCDVMFVLMFGDDAHLVASIEAGATGYLLKDATEQRIAAGIHELRLGGSPISPSIARRLLSRSRVSVTPGAPDAPATAWSEPPLLIERETEILRLTTKGLGFDTIGGLLQISPHIVVAHVKKIYRRLAVHSRSEAVYEASQLGLL